MIRLSALLHPPTPPYFSMMHREPALFKVNEMQRVYDESKPDELWGLQNWGAKETEFVAWAVRLEGAPSLASSET
jgi:hypothetical protein